MHRNDLIWMHPFFTAKMKFKTFGLISLTLVYLLILAGGIVRSTGSGMGCPDWPKCFGRFIPPTEVSQLPLNYTEIYQEKLHGEVIFNPTKTWIEYLNRLLGALTGLSVLITTIFAWKENKKTFLFSLLALVFVLANAVLGKYVVDSFLLPGVVTAHMILTIAVIYFLLKALLHNKEKIKISKEMKNWVIINLAFIAIQIILGTQVRENMDHVIQKFGESQKDLWIDNLSNAYIIHRSFTWVIIISSIYLYRKLNINHTEIVTYKNQLITFLGISVISGVIMAYLAMPMGSQPIHLTLSLLILGLHMKALIKFQND
jgi:cytochrome c oxidase assembly protein subunit 15